MTAVHPSSKLSTPNLAVIKGAQSIRRIVKNAGWIEGDHNGSNGWHLPTNATQTCTL
ncbi:hypothetical protein CYLTODRAFT_424140 [Cylindrobasidium torrendii FP15055 ss-10]|uniref:Uncharacterized protein n=1 Tax=Cylindrobasidium torrendii FP15055 ss-10 TaxID=1314674 RepID=A0A0D7B845_9AGAR|nr:hypothetical protein CYLTODRAFT_424140 [Cylindrobasidium torrendii FP15055 ss-10]